jgi:glutathione S-transferase
MSGTAPLRLYTFTISHYSEKIRWLLDSSGLAYEELPMTPGLHLPKAFWLSRRGTSVPILQADGVRVQDSRRIVRWLAERHDLRGLLPRDLKLCDEALAVEAAQDDVGRAVMRVVYERLVNEPALVYRFWTLDAGSIEKGILRVLLPSLLHAFRRLFGINDRNIVAAHATVARRLDEIESMLARGTRYLVGDRFTIADIATCALLAPLAAPDWHPIYGAPSAREAMSAQVKAWQSRPAMRWVSDCYREFRPMTRGGSSFDSARGKLR